MLDLYKVQYIFYIFIEINFWIFAIFLARRVKPNGSFPLHELSWVGAARWQANRSRDAFWLVNWEPIGCGCGLMCFFPFQFQ